MNRDQVFIICFNIQYCTEYISYMLHVQSQFQYIFNSAWTERGGLVLII
jgi:hypothetical protein